MKLTSITPIPLSLVGSADDPSHYLRGARVSFLLIRAELDNGAVGYGEVCDSFCCSYPDTLATLVEEAFAPLLVGKDLVDVPATIDEVRRLTRRRLGDHGPVVQALSGVEIALWDLRGKVEGKSVSQLLGAERNAVPVYASGSFLDEGNADWHARYFEPLLKRGVGAIKVRLGRDYQSQLETLGKLTKLLGGIRVLVDGNEGFTAEQALEIAKVLAGLHVFFFEEPIAQCERAAIAELVDRSPLPIAYGEHLFLPHDFEDCLLHRRANYLQPDASICGGIAAGLEIGRLAAQFRVPVAPHSAAGAVSLAANLHMAAAVSNLVMLEYSFPLAPMWQQMAGGALSPAEISDGCIRVPQRPGLGVEVDERVVSLKAPKQRRTEAL
jgi:L-alanine-DL-glutamate epimerase-like enolase superfamily enzyme